MNQKTIKTLFNLLPLIFLSFFLLFQNHFQYNKPIAGNSATTGALSTATAEISRPLTKNKDKSTQQIVSTIAGAATGGLAGANTALEAENNNRQLHQKEIEWVNSHIKDFAATAGISPENAKKLLTTAALSLVDAKSNMAINLHLLTDKGFTKAQLQYAQEYLLQNSKGLTFNNSFSNNREEQLFTTHNIVEYLMPYDPNRGPKAQIVKMGAEAALAGNANLIGKGYNILNTTGKQAVGGAAINGGYDLYNQTNHFTNFSNIDYIEFGISSIAGSVAAVSKNPTIAGAVAGGATTTYTEIRDKGITNLDKESVFNIGINSVAGGIGGKAGYETTKWIDNKFKNTNWLRVDGTNVIKNTKIPQVSYTGSKPFKAPIFTGNTGTATGAVIGNKGADLLKNSIDNNESK